MVVIQFCGFRQSEIDAAMPQVVKLLGLGHDVYSVHCADPVMLYDKDGKFQGTGKMIVMPMFSTINASPNILNAVSRELGVPVTTVWAEPKLAIGDNLF